MSARDLISKCLGVMVDENKSSSFKQSITHEGLSRRLGCCSSTISLIYNDQQKVGASMILRVHEHLDIPVKEIREILAKK
jgi:hypothetical protein